MKFVPVFRVVPNGVSSIDGQQQLRVTLLATPSPVADSSSGAFAIENWPSAVADWLSKQQSGGKGYQLKLFLQPIEQSGQKPVCFSKEDPIWADLGPLRRAHAPKSAAPQWAVLDARWQRAFESAAKTFSAAASPWDILAEQLKHSAGNQAFDVAVADEQRIPDDKKDHLKQSINGYGALEGTGSGQGVRETIGTVVPISHAFFARELTQKRANRVADALKNDRPKPQRDRGRAPADREKHRPDPTSEVPNGKEELLKAKRDRLWKSLMATNDLRERTTQQYKDIRSGLEDSACLLPQATPQTATTQSDSEKTNEKIAAHQYGTWAQYSPADAAADPGKDAIDAVTQLFFAVQSSPALSRLFGLAFDATIGLGAFEDEYGSVTKDRPIFAYLSAAEAHTPESCVATAVRLDYSSKSASRFLPATRAELFLTPHCTPEAKNAWLDGCDQHDGLVPMRGALATPPDDGLGDERFVLTSLDIRGAVDHALQGDTANGEVLQLKDDGQRLATVGFSFHDRRRALGALEELAVLDVDGKGPSQQGAVPALFAEDLTVGHVIDVAVSGKTGRTWRCLGERYVSYDDLETLGQVVPVLIGAKRSEARLDLEQSHIAPTTRIVPKPAGEGDKPPATARDLIIEETVAVWNGSPMGVDTGAYESALPDENEGDKQKKASEPIARRILDLPNPTDPDGRNRRPPPLRYGHGYWFGMRCVYAGGGGLSLQDAQQNYDEKASAFALPSAEMPQIFRRNESILKPDVLMQAGPARAEYGVMGFESLNVVLRRGIMPKTVDAFLKQANADPGPSLTDRSTPQRTTRIIMPPPVGMEDVARHGLFDGPGGHANWQVGAMPKLDYKGGYPKCPDKVERGWNDEIVTISRRDPTFDAAQGMATFRLRSPRSAPPPKERYFPDPAARFLIIGLRRKDSSDQDAYEQIAKVPFYTHGNEAKSLAASDYQTLAPVLLDFRCTGDAATRIGKPVRTSLADSGYSVTVNRVVIELAPHDAFDVVLWCAPDPDTLARQFALPQYLADIDRPDLADKLIEHVTTKGPIEELGAVRVVGAVHAVNLPSAAPVVEKSADSTDRLPASAPKPGETETPGAGFLLPGSLTLATASTDTYELYVSCASPHSSLFDDPARGRTLIKRRASIWPTAPGSRPVSSNLLFGFDVEPTGKVRLPVAAVQLVRGEGVPLMGTPPGPAQLDLADILRSANGLPPTEDPPPKIGAVTLSHRFNDMLARKLEVTAVAIARHAGAFSTPSTFGTENGRRTERRVIPLERGLQSLASPGEPIEIWLNAKMRPSPPAVLSSEPSFFFKPDCDTEPGTVSVTRFANVRIRLKRPWFSSGEEERLAIVLARADGATQSYLDGLNGRAALVSRWGGDPVWPGKPGESELRGFGHFDLDRCNHAYEEIPEYSLPVPDALPEGDGKVAASDTPKSEIPVSLLAFEPHFDVDREEWYVDVPLCEHLAGDPFVRFVVVRYQAHTSANFLKTSEPVELWAKKLPSRRVKAVLEEEASGALKVDCFVKGREHNGPYVPPNLKRAGTARPHIRAHLFHESLAAASGAPDAADLAARSVRRQSAFPPGEEFPAEFADGKPWPGSVDDSETEIEFCATIPKERRDRLGRGQFVLFVSDFERFMPATYSGDFADPVTWDDMKEEATLVETGSRFSLRIDLPDPPKHGGPK